ncbi:Haloacid dehalogenase-like hydrolase domain-containing protein [Thalictrum thalictroides]|uniref:Haloacid dehalogenase-like hydrolase domain-containing protein n=1 Tax=Thalictrum thalictroides TaxID=46969 RepID=A0A7J6WL94_THATH|nr:Haloacid dehalogenase-like hydrolase domain-containing protein [Thalictrum thalictroides]
MMTMSLLNKKLFQTTTLVVFVLHLLYFEASCFDQQPPSALPQEKLLTEEKMRLGSRPPSCYNRCSECHPCMAVQVPTIPNQPGMGTIVVPLLNKEEYYNTHPSSASKKYTNYKPLGWKCRCEHLHRQAYNDAFAHFNVRCSISTPEPLNWSPDFYDVLQNQIGGGKPKMRWYFKENGWPSSTIFDSPPKDDSDRAKLIDTLQDWKTERYKEIIKSGTVEPRPGVLRLMDEAKAAGIKLAVCSAATKSSVILCLENLIGMERFHGLDCFLAGDDVKEKKPDPSIYITASEKLGLLGKNCMVVEDSVIGLQAATSAGMPCVITYTTSTASQDFKEASAIYPDLTNVRLADLESLLQDVILAK